ncbi:hypothetical protein KR009_000158 [Drosophila setifemur]|nr:hypothetical protein KR009_000158 [Drosophila setifemur]
MPYRLLADPQSDLNLFICPINCVCQHTTFDELPISRWINNMTTGNADDDYKLSTHTKLATCLLQTQDETRNLLDALPMDLQALTLLYTGRKNHRMAVNVSSLRKLNQLTSFELRGMGAILVIDEPLEFLLYANFEQIQLQASERLQRPKFENHPNEKYDYKPPSDLLPASQYPTKYTLQFEYSTAEILTYEQHIQRQKQTLMPSFYGWRQLKVLRIHDCHLNELHWQIFDGLIKLKHLSLEKNNIGELPPFAFSGASNLKSISLAHNLLDRLHYLGLAGLLELETLNLSDNQLERLSELSFPPLPKLRAADLRSNPVKIILPATFWVMNATRELQLGSGQAALNVRTFNIYGQFDSLCQLRTLTLGNVSTQSLEQGVFKGLYGLEVLTLRGSINIIQFDVFAEMGQLRELDISHCNIRELSMDALMGAKRLQLLNLSHNNLANVPPGLLDDQQQLTDVQLQGNQLKSLPTNFFLLPRLRVVRLDQNPWQCTCQMSNWIPRLTNVVRGPTVETCVTNNKDAPLSCRHIHTYEMNKTLVPRCTNYHGRSVYYVLRRQLHCSAMPIFQLAVQNRIKQRGFSHWQKVQLHKQKERQIRPLVRTNRVMQQRNSFESMISYEKMQTSSNPLAVELSNEI